MMEISRLRSRKFVALAIAAGVFLVAGMVFAMIDLGVADQAASVGSFFVGLVTLGFSLYSLRAPREQGERKRGNATFRDIESLTIGDKNKIKITKNYGVLPENERKPR